MSITGIDCIRRTTNRTFRFSMLLFWNLMYSSCFCNLYVFLVSRFSYRLDRWFSRLNGFTLVILGPFIACCSVWAMAPCWRPYLWWFTFINCYLDGELSHWHSHHIFLYLFNFQMFLIRPTLIRQFQSYKKHLYKIICLIIITSIVHD